MTRPHRRTTASRSRLELKARSAWDRAIDPWDDFEETGKDFSRDLVHGPALLRAIGPIRGRRVLDLGCGQGRFTRSLARRGGRVVGIDWSDEMIEAARRHERDDPLGVEYLRVDARAVGQRWKAGSFDLVVSCMALMDMPDLPRVLRHARRLLRSSGRFVFSISHPLNTAAVGWDRASGSGLGSFRVERYFEERAEVLKWRMARLSRPFDTIFWHRTLETWFESLQRSGFAVERLWEPRASASQERRFPLLKRSNQIPFFLVLRCRPVSGRGS